MRQKKVNLSIYKINKITDQSKELKAKKYKN